MDDYALLPLPENDFQAHADVLSDYQGLMVSNVTATAPGATNVPGTVIYGAFTPNAPDPSQGAVYNAIILPVQQHQLPRAQGGGLVPHLLCTVSILKSDLPVGLVFGTGQLMYANPPWSYQRLCQIFTIEDCYTSWLIALMDVSENA